jgi:hypothetical protein
VKKIGAGYIIAIVVATVVARCAAQAVLTEQRASASVRHPQGFVVHGSAQSITLPAAFGQSVNSPPLRLRASDSAGLPVTFGSLTPSACTVSNNVVTFSSNRTCTIAADSGGDGMYVSASQVTPDLTGCEDCSTGVPTLPQWCAIVMGLVLIGISIFLMRRFRASTIA